jgi:Fe-S cluster biogenesis protein NfuA
VTQAILSTETLAERVETVLEDTVRPALSSHAGTIRLVRVDGVGEHTQGTDESRPIVHLELIGSCSACYFRRACVTGVVRPALEERVGGPRYVVDNARI